MGNVNQKGTDKLCSSVVLRSLRHSRCAKRCSFLIFLFFFFQYVTTGKPPEFFPSLDSRLRIRRPTQAKKHPSSRECPIAARDTMQNALWSVSPFPTNWKLISLVAIVRSSRRFRMSKSPVRKTVSSFKLDNLSALRSE